MKLAIKLSLFVLAASFYSSSALANTSAGMKTLLGPKELEELSEPIALYPDMLVQMILPASTFPDQIVDAALLVKDKADAAKIKDQKWDPSVKAVANYPGVLKMMFTELQWTTNLGEAFLHQNRELLDSIQRLRGKAEALGNLKSDEGQKVTEQKAPNGNTYITIESQDPEVVYIPSSSTTVYEEKNSSDSVLVPLATFGLGMAVGAAMNDDDGDHYYYGGGGGYWYGGNPTANHWMDNRRAAWEDYNDRKWDQQDYRQDVRDDKREFRQNQVESGNWNKPTQQQKDAAKQKANDRRASYQNSGTASTRAQNARTQAQTTRSQSTTRSSYGPQSGSGYGPQNGRGYGSTSRSSNTAFSSYGSRSSTARASSRGSMSRSYGGGGRSGGGGRGGRGGGRR